MGALRWAWLLVLWTGCERFPVRDEVRVDAGHQVRKNPNRWIDYRRPCVRWAGDAGGCDAGLMVFDGTSCRPACEALDAGDPRAFTDTADCVVTCQCDLSKFDYPISADRRCEELWIFTEGPIDWDAGTCVLAPNRSACTAWSAGFGYGNGGGPLLEDGVRLACEASLKTQVSRVYCYVWGE